MKLGELAEQLGLELHGDAQVEVTGVGVLQEAGPDQLSFLANRKYRRFLPDSRAGAVLVSPDDLDACPGNALVSSNPYLSYARAAALLHPAYRPEAGISQSSWIDPTAKVDPSAHVAPGCVVEAGAELAAGVVVGPNCVVGRNCRVGEGTRLVASVTLCADSQIGKDCLIHPGVVIGADGFGLAPDGEGRWERVPQLGRVIIGDDVDIGANTTVDRGAIGDTVIHDGAKLDNLIQVAHNVEIGEGTAIAACTGISGSTRIGAHCTIAGGVGMVGHIEIADGSHVAGFSLVSRSITEPGVYAGSLPSMPHGEWGKNFARIRQLDDMAKRIRKLEKALAERVAQDDSADEEND